MTESTRFNFAARLVAVALSCITMLWLLWRFPTPTCVGSIVLLGFLLHCAHFARVVDVAVGSVGEAHIGLGVGVGTKIDHENAKL